MTHLPTYPEHLLRNNDTSKTPLEITVEANKVEVVEWILRRLSKTQHVQRVKDCVRLGFRGVAIISEEEDILVSLTILWPEWDELLVSRYKDDLFDSLLQSQDKSLVFAVKHNKFKAVEVLLTQGANVKHRNAEYSTPFKCALLYSMPDMIELLTTYKPDRARSSVLNSALRRGFADQMVRTGTDPNVLLIAAARIHLVDTIRALLQYDLSTEAHDITLTYPDLWIRHELDANTWARSKDEWETVKPALRKKGGRSWLACSTQRRTRSNPVSLSPSSQQYTKNPSP
jgi:hypothetical protein